MENADINSMSTKCEKTYEWTQIHDFLYGFGMHEVIPDNEIVLEDHPGVPGVNIPWKIVKSKQKEKRIWLRETERWLGITEIFTMTSKELYEIYDKLQPFIQKERERRRNLPPPIYDKISLPQINRVYPML